MHRTTDNEPGRYFQTERFFRVEGQWYFATREGIDFGPFTIRHDGERALQRYLDTQHTMQRLRRRDPGLAKESQWDSQSVADAANEISQWRLDRNQRPDGMYSDRSKKHR